MEGDVDWTCGICEWKCGTLTEIVLVKQQWYSYKDVWEHGANENVGFSFLVLEMILGSTMLPQLEGLFKKIWER